MKVFFFSESMTLSGGLERVLSCWADHFARRNDEVTVLNVYGEGSFYPLDPRVKVETLGIGPPSPGLKKFVRYSRIVRALRRLFKSTRFDFFVANSPALGCCSLVASRLLGKRAPRIIICDHSSYVAASKLWNWARRRLYRHAYAVIALTRADLPKYQEIGARVLHIPNPQPWRAPALAKKDSRTALAIGRMTQQKGFDLLLEAWKGVVEKHPEWSLEIVGGGEEEGSLLAQRARLGLEKSVRFIPSKTNIHENYLAASLFISSSRSEGLPMVLIEAKSFGLPCVAFDCETGPREIIRDGVDGLLARPEDVSDLSAKILAILSEPAKIQAFGERAAEDSLRFQPEQVMKLWDDMLSAPSEDAVSIRKQ